MYLLRRSAAGADPAEKLQRLHAMNSARIMAVLNVTSTIVRFAGQPPAGVQLSAADSIDLLIYLQVFQVILATMPRKPSQLCNVDES